MAASDDVRKSLDVLDRVLSEFDDIDGLSSTGGEESDINKDEAPVPKTPSPPPPIDRTTKPRFTPPALPKKTRKPPSSFERISTNEAVEKNNSIEKKTSLSRSIDRSDVSSHEYQEISSDIVGPPRKRGGSEPRRSESERHPANGNQGRHKSQDRPPKRSTSGHWGQARDADAHQRGLLRKSRSGEVSLPDDGHGRGRRPTKRTTNRRSKSSERLLEQKMMEQNELNGMVDPRFDPGLVDPRLIDPRLIEPQFIDPRIPYENQHFDHRRFRSDPRDNHFVPMDDSVHFPHLLGSPHLGPHLQPHPLSPMMEYPTHPLNIPPYPPMSPYEMSLIQENMMGMQFGHPQFDPHIMDPRMGGYDPRMMPPQMDYPMDYPVDMYPMDMPMDYPRERINFPVSRSMPPQWDGKPFNKNQWIPPGVPDQRMGMQRIARTRSRNSADDDRVSEDSLTEPPQKDSEEMEKPKQVISTHKRRLTSTGHSDSSGRSSPLEDLRGSRKSSLGIQRGQTPQSSAFIVGDVVREEEGGAGAFGQKEILSMPNFVSAGKDSGFDEGPLIEDPSKTASSGTPSIIGNGGSFIVSGVFNDSSKMYIPAPPSPTPDYDEVEDSDGGDSDILLPEGKNFDGKEAKKDKSKRKNKHETVVKKSSLSDDSLQESTGELSEKEKRVSNTGSLQAMMEEFHSGLPSPLEVNEEGARYSDDSLEESMPSSSRPTTLDYNKRPTSLESLVSMASTTSFDYMSGEHSKSSSNLNRDKKDEISPAKSKNLKGVKVSSPIKIFSKFGRDKAKESIKVENQVEIKKIETKHRSNFYKDPTKFDTIRHLIKEGLIEGLDETPPEFKPPPPMTGRRTSSPSSPFDSGMGSTVSTNRTDESGGSDNHSEKSNSPPSMKTPLSESFSNDHFKDEAIVLDSRPLNPSPPPPPPIRDSSIRGSGKENKVLTPTTPVDTSITSRNKSWLHKNKRPAPQPTPNRQQMHKRPSEEKITHVDDIIPNRNRSQERSFENRIGGGRTISDQYASPVDQKSSTNHDYREKLTNLTNLERTRPDTLSIISEDQRSLNSNGSKTGSFLSRLSESMKSSRQTPSPRGSTRTTTKLTSSSRSSTRVHGDIIRNPTRLSDRQILMPPQIPTIVSPSTVIPFTRDGSGRFRSIEDLSEAAAEGRVAMRPEGQAKQKKNSTLPPNLNPQEMLEIGRRPNKDNRRSAYIGEKDKEDSSCCNDGSKFRFNPFKGFWKRNKYSFDKA